MSGPAKSEVRWTLYRLENGTPKFLVTSDANRSWYFLYDISGPEPIRLGKERTPTLLENKYKVCDQLKSIEKKGRSK